ncbi:uncharacterized protein VTP21DRAFT_9027 [Calcarisporiella thermophila]|uniref:uncharacterized protein n=1 Tax=Calcarisporiella thermophila TaxID=911321 RepID=UPI0037429AF1
MFTNQRQYQTRLRSGALRKPSATLTTDENAVTSNASRVKETGMAAGAARVLVGKQHQILQNEKTQKVKAPLGKRNALVDLSAGNQQGVGKTEKEKQIKAGARVTRSTSVASSTITANAGAKPTRITRATNITKSSKLSVGTQQQSQMQPSKARRQQTVNRSSSLVQVDAGVNESKKRKASDNNDETTERVTLIRQQQGYNSASATMEIVEEEKQIAEKHEAEEEETRAAKKARIHEQLWDDLDAEDADDPLMASEYVVEIFQYMRQLEDETMPTANYMDNQRELSWKMRGILADWLIEVHHKFRLLPETLYLALNIIDRFLSLKAVSVQKLQLVGITALFIAAKYEEILAPSVHSLLRMTDDGYSEEELLKAERYVLAALNFKLSYPNPMHFLRRVSKADQYDIQTRTVAKYLLELPLVEHRLLTHKPSLTAAASLYLARRMLNRGEWNYNLAHYSGYEESELQATTNLMLEYLSKPPAHEAIFKKYASKKFLKASIFVRDWVAENNKISK